MGEWGKKKVKKAEDVVKLVLQEDINFGRCSKLASGGTSSTLDTMVISFA